MKFSIRDLFLVTVIVALGLGWWVDHRRGELEADRLYKNWEESERFSQEQISAFEAALDDAKPGWRNADGSISFESGPNGLRLAPGQNPPNPSAPAPNPPKP